MRSRLFRILSTVSALPLAVSLLAPSPLAAQANGGNGGGSVAATARASIAATRADLAPIIDGRADDAIWQTAPAQDGFREWRPTEDGDPKQRTEFRVAYDPNYLYVFVRAYDTSPDSIISLMARRDDLPAADWLTVMVDSYNDKRTGFGFIVNPAGVKYDYAISNDSNEDDAWDAIWDVAVSRDAEGWAAEYRIPFSQLRFAPSENVTFGFMVSRMLQRHTAQLAWPLFRTSRPGYSSQFAELTGLTGLAAPARTELVPYVLTQNEPDRATGGIDRNQRVTVGGDLKYAVAPNITLNATVNPDFGQVEADPSVLNLGAFETFFSERRPFFVEGANVFDFRINCFIVVDCSTGEALFYSRRIGRQPSIGRYADDETPTSTRIIGAAKLTGRFQNGMSFGFLDAVTEHVTNASDQTVEPLTNYSALRLNRDTDGGNTSMGLMLTGVNRSLDQWSESSLHSAAYSGGFDARRRFGRYEVSGSLMGSYVTGTDSAITRTQRSSTHLFQRPDDGIDFDSNATSLRGSAVELRFAKVGGQFSRFETGFGQRSAGFETNDLGFLNRADQRSWTNWFALRWNKPNQVFQRLNWNMNYWMYWTGDGLLEEQSFNTNVHTQLNNRWWFHLGGTKSLAQTYCARGCTRGGPALRVDPGFFPWGGIESDSRKKVTGGIWWNYNYMDGGRSHYSSIEPWMGVKLSSRFRTNLSVDFSRNDDDSQWFGNFTDSVTNVTHFTFADLQQRTMGVTWRLDYIFSPNASFQFYASPFISKGTYSRVREIDDPRASDYDDRFQTAPDSVVTAGGTVDLTNPGGFNFQAFNSNAVFRWEYRPGSTLFLVWSQGRGAFDPTEGNRSFRGDLDNLFGTRAEDRFLVKVSYWLNR